LKQYYARNHKNLRFASVFHLHVAGRHEKGLKSCEGVSLRPSPAHDFSLLITPKSKSCQRTAVLRCCHENNVNANFTGVHSKTLIVQDQSKVSLITCPPFPSGDSEQPRFLI